MSRRPHMLRALAQRNYRLWAAADFLSVSGSWMQVLGVNWLLLSITGSATSLGLGLALQSLPTMVLSLVGGSLADRLPARGLVLTGQVAYGLLALGLAVFALTDAQTLWPIYAVALLGGLVAALVSPAIGRFGAETVGPKDMSNALALGSVLSSAGRILGMGLAGVLIPLTGTGVLFLINAVSFVGVIAAVLCMRSSEMHPLPRAERHDSGIIPGLRYIARTPWLLVIFALAFVLGSLGRNYQVTMAAMSQGPLQAGASGYGMLSVVFSVGAVLGGLYAASRGRLTFRMLLISGGFISAVQAVSGFMPGVWSFAALMLPIAAGAVLLDTAVGTRVQLDTKEEMRGRVLAAHGIVGAASGAVGGPLLGYLCDTAGARLTLVVAGSISLVLTVVASALLMRMLGRTNSLSGVLAELPVLRRIPTARNRVPAPAAPVPAAVLAGSAPEPALVAS